MNILGPLIQFLRDTLPPVRNIRTRIWLGWLSLINRYGRAPVTQPDGPVLSLTTYGMRIRTVYLTIESIARGRQRPSEFILWLDDENAFNRLPPTLQRLKARGLTIRLAKNYGPHKKYYPYVESQGAFIVPLVTADDDILYPPSWLKGLVDGFRASPEVIHCYRARVITFDHTGLTKYTGWKLCTATCASFCHFATGVSGVLYPPSFLNVLKNAGNAFETCCPKADDVWLHVQALRAGFKIRQISAEPLHFKPIPGTQSAALHLRNVTDDNGNDRQIKATYTQTDIETLRCEFAEHQRSQLTSANPIAFSD